MLTVWRKLHIEWDSMKDVEYEGDEKNCVTGNIVSVLGESYSVLLDKSIEGDYSGGDFIVTVEGDEFVHSVTNNNGSILSVIYEPPPGNPWSLQKEGLDEVTGDSYSLLGSDGTMVDLGQGLADDNMYHNGVLRVKIDDDTYERHNVRSSSLTYIYLASEPQQDITGKSFMLIDDDSEFNAENIPESKAIMPVTPDFDGLRDALREAFIERVVDGGGNENNNDEDVEFDLNTEDIIEAMGARKFDSGENRCEQYWISYILIGYQNKLVADENGDHDPDSESCSGGASFFLGDTIWINSLVFHENIRDVCADPNAIEKLTITHEIGWQFELPKHQSQHDSGCVNYGETAQGDCWCDQCLNRLRNRVKSPCDHQ